MARALEAGQVVRVKGRRFRISRSGRKGKHWRACCLTGRGRCIHFGQPGATVKPGTPKGDSFCARSYPLSRKQASRAATANDLARLDWRCKGKKSRR